MRKNLAVLLVLLLALGAGACVTVTGSGSARDMQAGAEVNRIRLHAALQAGDMATVDAMLSGAEIRVPSGAEPGQERDIVRAALGAEEVLFHPEGVARCTDALHEYGAFVVRTYDGPDEYAQLGRYALLWGRGADERIELRRIALFDVEEGRLYRNPPCVTVADSVFDSRRIWMALHPKGARGAWQDGLLSSAQATGWQPSRAGQRIVESEAHRRGTIFIQVGLPGPAVAGATVGQISGRTQFHSPTGRIRRLTYEGTHLALAGGAEFRMPVVPVLRASASAGPALLRLNGSWETVRWDDPDDDAQWSASAIGVTSEVGVTMPLGSRFGLTAHFQHRWYPDPEIPGNLGSDPFRASFSHNALLLGFGSKVW